MNNSKRNIIVGLFVLIGLAVLGWMLMKFQNLPAFLSSIDARIISINFPQAPGIEENSPVLFCGYPVGKVVKVSPPALMIVEKDHPEKKSYQIQVQVAIDKEYDIPGNAIAKVIRRGLGGSYIEFKLSRDKQPEGTIKLDEPIQGEMSEATEFISENTQHTLNELVNSLTDLSESLNKQVVPLPPEKVDATKAKIQPNLTTVVMRMDKVVKNLNIFLADVSNQQNLKKGLANFAAIGDDIKQITKKIDALVNNANNLVQQTSTTVKHIDKYAGNVDKYAQQAGGNINTIAETAQNIADNLSAALGQLQIMLTRINAGQGTAGRLMNDPRLYEILTDAVEQLGNRMKEMQPILENISENGLLAKPKKRPKRKTNYTHPK